MPTLNYVCGLGCGSPAIGQVGSHHPASLGDVAPTIVSSGHFASGRAMQFAGASQTCYIRTDTVTPNSQWFVLRAEMYFDSAPTNDVQIGPWGGVLLGQLAGFVYRVADGKLYVTNGANFAGLTDAASGVDLPIGKRFILDIEIDQRANPRIYNGWIDGVAMAGRTSATAAANVNVQGWGSGLTTSATFSYLMGGLAQSITPGDAPIGEGFVKYYLPDADGTHNLGAAGNIQDAGGTDINAASNPAFGDLDELPDALDANHVDFKTDTGGGTYIELDFPNSVEPIAPLSVDATVYYRGAAANAYAGQWRTSADAFAGSDNNALSPATGTTQRCMREAYPTTPGTGAAWTTALFNAFKLRFGFGTDVTPDIRFNATVIEAFFGKWPTVDYAMGQKDPPAEATKVIAY